MTEVWIRNPVTCIRECAELVVPRIVWDRGFCVKQRIEPQRHLELHYPSGVDYQLMLIGAQGAVEIRRGKPFEAPHAVYPVWVYGDMMIPDLEEMMKSQKLPNGRRPDEIGVQGQDHKVVITNMPHMQRSMGKALIRTLLDLQEDYPNCQLHIHGLYGWKEMFAHGWHGVDCDPVEEARRGRVRLPSGRVMLWEKASGYSQWVSTLGFTVGQLSSPQERTKYNIKSAMWAGAHFREEMMFRARNDGRTIDWKTPDRDFKPPTTTYVRPPRHKQQEGDKLLCNQCSLAPVCKYFREGGVCAIPNTDGSELAKFFKTRDSEQIISGLGKVLQTQSERFEEGRSFEKVKGELDPEVTRVGNAIFTAGVKLAKLIDPKLNQPGVQVNVGIANHQASASAELANTPAQIMSMIVRELTEQGVPLDAITPSMVAEYLVSTHRNDIEKMTAIEVTAG